MLGLAFFFCLDNAINKSTYLKNQYVRHFTILVEEYTDESIKNQSRFFKHIQY